ncbi:MAG: undecaprenyl-diphosphate phosphatase [Rhodospirillaceae bacterium]|nr:undecaprenyl-diphosphate phosphatase [Rhodospirillaceae bacterium]
MALTQAVVFAVLQGLGAVFPIGTSVHIALLTEFTGWEAPGPAVVIATQAGVLLAMLAYFWADLFDMGVGVVRAAKGKRDPGARLAAQFFVSAIAAVAVLFALERYAPGVANTQMMIGWLSAGGALALLAFDRMCMTVKRVEHATFVDAVLIGLAQAVSLLPGVRNAGASLTVARLLGYERDEAVRFSMLAGALPLAVVLVKTLIEARTANAAIHFERTDLIMGSIGFVMALASLASLMSWLRRSTFTVFAVYRLLAAAAVLVLAYDLISLSF